MSIKLVVNLIAAASNSKGLVTMDEPQQSDLDLKVLQNRVTTLERRLDKTDRLNHSQQEHIARLGKILIGLVAMGATYTVAANRVEEFSQQYAQIIQIAGLLAGSGIAAKAIGSSGQDEDAIAPPN